MNYLLQSPAPTESPSLVQAPAGLLGTIWIWQRFVGNNEKGSFLLPYPAAYRLELFPDGNFHLTGREVEVLQATARGMANKEIADALCISSYTVQVHLRNIFGKLGVDNRTEAVTYALAQGWINLK